MVPARTTRLRPASSRDGDGAALGLQGTYDHERVRIRRQGMEERSFVVPARLTCATLLASLLVVTTACGIGPFGTGWRGADVHRVEDTWIGTEQPCRDGDADCHLVLERALDALVPRLRDRVTSAVLADVPDTYVTATGETRRAPVMRGLDRRKALVVELVDGQRRVMGLWCYLPRTNHGTLVPDAVSCSTGDLSYWRDGQMPPGGLR